MPCRDFGNISINRVHFIGVGGVGMSGIASVAKCLGMQVSGSDLKESKYSRVLRSEGIDVFIGQVAENIANTNPDIVVVSTAIPETNPELVAARKAGIPVWCRAQMLAYVTRDYKVIAAAGTHGKTTTSSMASSALYKLGGDPSFLVGGILDGFDNNARYGKGDYCVIEADESDGSFTYLDPYIAIITNIEPDHLDHYEGGIEEIRAAFADFISEIPEEGWVIACGDGEGVEDVVRSATKAGIVMYGLSENNDVVVVPADDGSFEARFSDGSSITAKLQVNPGVHNMLNATAVIIALNKIGYSLEDAARAVEDFSGVRRRFDLVGKEAGITVIDDYGHHPTEIAATLQAARSMGFKKVHVLFQPHRYSRTASLADEFGSAFDNADDVVVMDVYSAGETPIPGITGKTVVDAVLKHDPQKQAVWIQGFAEVAQFVADRLEDGDLLITMGAGDVTSVGPRVIAVLRERMQ